MNILSLSLDTSLFDPTSDVFARHKYYATLVDSYTVIVFNLYDKKVSSHISGNLKIIPTQSRSKLLYLFDALGHVPKGPFSLVTAQDPFLTGLAGVLIKYIRAIPLNIQIHSDFFATPYFRGESLFNLFLYLLGRWTLTQANSVRVRNQKIGRNLVKLYPHLLGKIGYIAQSINPLYFSPLSPQKRDSRLLLSIGRLVKQKNYPLLINSFTSLKTKFPDLKLIIIGEGEERGSLQKMNPQVEFLGTQKPQVIKHYLDKASVFVLPSNHEGWGLVCLEALSRGTPVLMTDTGCAGEIVIHNKTGYVVPVADKASLMSGLETILSHPSRYQQMARRGRNLVKKDSSPQEIKKRMLSLFRLTLLG